MRVFSLNLIILLAAILPVHAADVFLEPNVFLAEVFEGDVPSPSFLWLKGDVKETAKEILGRNMGGLRQRYWQADGRTVWIVEEIGKTRPITTGISVKDGAVERVQILIYRESHGWEVRYPFFTDQFQGMTLDAERETSSRVDGISGATLSVRAIVKLVRLSLAFDQLARDGS
ncbi:MAG: FMN-binding protein [Parvibaculum sp.]|jgi:hypothetical protein|nr:FMN-binding protein [Parvibaculum sp.]|tara:strand:+ start:2480 stop:2998 length:519 start_codon:yes stop_codon:yes gene_type:complete